MQNLAVSGEVLPWFSSRRPFWPIGKVGDYTDPLVDRVRTLLPVATVKRPSSQLFWDEMKNPDLPLENMGYGEYRPLVLGAF